MPVTACLEKRPQAYWHLLGARFLHAVDYEEDLGLLYSERPPESLGGPDNDSQIWTFPVTAEIADRERPSEATSVSEVYY
jgi:hypothetical protein